MRWPWTPRETRADSSYTDALVAAITANAGGQSSAFPTATSALESCAGFVGRAFASAEVGAPDMFADALDPSCLSLIGRALIRRGEIVFLIRTDGGTLRLLPCESHDVDGSPDPMTWRYRCTVGGPERTLTYDHVPAEGVVHIAYAREPERPWRGYGPLQVAQLAGRLSAETTAALADEASGPRGSFLSVPVDGADPTVATMKADVKTAKGGMLLGQGGDWDSGATGGRAIWETKRFGADPPAGLVTLMERSHDEVVGACGLTGLFSPKTDGTGRRESYRQALHVVIAPLGRIVATELSRKLESDITLDWAELRAGDISGRARAFQSMVGAGMDPAKAAALAGLMMADGE